MGLGIVDWKSTVVSNLLALLLVNILTDHLIGDRAGADRQVATCPQMPSPKLPAQVGKLLQQYSRAAPLQPLYDLAYVLVGAIRQEQVNMVACGVID